MPVHTQKKINERTGVKGPFDAVKQVVRQKKAWALGMPSGRVDGWALVVLPLQAFRWSPWAPRTCSPGSQSRSMRRTSSRTCSASLSDAPPTRRRRPLKAMSEDSIRRCGHQHPGPERAEGTPATQEEADPVLAHVCGSGCHCAGPAGPSYWPTGHAVQGPANSGCAEAGWLP